MITDPDNEVCPHGLSLWLCADPINHYPSDDRFEGVPFYDDLHDPPEYWPEDYYEEDDELLPEVAAELRVSDLLDHEPSVCDVCGKDEHTPEELKSCIDSALGPVQPDPDEEEPF